VRETKTGSDFWANGYGNTYRGQRDDVPQRIAKLKCEIACLEDEPNPDSRDAEKRVTDRATLAALRTELNRLDPADPKAKNKPITLAERRTAESSKTVSPAASSIPLFVQGGCVDDSARPHDDNRKES
jgi:hypothetical protein